MERLKIETAYKDGKWGVMYDGIEVVPFCHDSKIGAIEEWAYFEKLNTEREPHRRFLNRVTPLDDIAAEIKKVSDEL